eukprot:TRINITY_DN14234_c0_g1_i3.p1 TRINITY_DN14234_c0_g1~~TRINITY_DN14234_c0_g1_i3.p1  ORF type:complete len:533 (+),score=122.47 TRINITY_DN14234_c0_g1_i3:59-1657(+)
MELNISRLIDLQKRNDEDVDAKLEERKKSFKPSCPLSRLILQENYAIKLRKQKKCELLSFKRAKLMMSEDRNFAQINPSAILNSHETSTAEELDFTYQALCSPIDSALLLPLLEKLRMLLCGARECSKALDKHEFIPKLLELASSSYEKIQFEALWILINMTAMHSKYSQQILSLNGHAKLIPLLHTSSKFKEQAIWLLGNIAGENEELRAELLKAGVLEEIVAVFKDNPNEIALVDTASWTIENLFKAEETPSATVITPFIELLNALMCSKESKKMRKGLEGLQKITANNEENIEIIVNEIDVKMLVACASRKESLLKLTALQVINNICTGEESEIKKLISYGLISMIGETLRESKDKAILEASISIVSSIMVGSENCIQQLIDEFVFKHLTTIVQKMPVVRHKAAAILVNACESGTESEIMQICVAGALEAFVTILELEDAMLELATLDVLDRILGLWNEDENVVAKEFDRLGIIAKLEELQLHPNIDVINRAQQLLDKHFDTYPLADDDVSMADMEKEHSDEMSQGEDD